jgi:hypothetical protein
MRIFTQKVELVTPLSMYAATANILSSGVPSAFTVPDSVPLPFLHRENRTFVIYINLIHDQRVVLTQYP